MSKTANQGDEPKTLKRTLHYFWQEIKKYKWYALGAIISTPIVVFVRAVLGTMIFADIIEKVSLGLPLEDLLQAVAVESILYIALYALTKVALEELRLFWTWRMEVLIMYDLANQCFDTVSAQSMQFHSDRFSGSLVSQTNKFVGSFERFWDVLIWDAWPMLCYITFIIVVLWQQAAWFAVGIVVLVVVYAIISALTMGRIAHLNNEEAAAYTKQTGQLADSISNIISVKSYAQEKFEQARFAGFSRKVTDASNNFMRATIKRDIMFNFVHIGITALLLAFLIFGNAWLGISVATLILIVNYANGVMGELWSINSIFKNFNRTFGDAHEMTLILDTVDDVVDLPNAEPLVLRRAEVDFRDITFQHADAKAPIFEDFNLKINDGERVGLVGVSGSGKTTLTKLLLRFADVSKGEITISGQNIKHVTQQTLRENIAYVPQETSLFHRSIADNIAYGKPDATPEEIKRAARLANADEFIMELPDGYDTLVGERGIKLSGGQRQRIAIARAILKDAPILVLDEATSALDSESEALIQSALERLMKGRTSIVIAHRLSTVAALDRIVVLQNGKIVEQGPHHELLDNSAGVYHHLWSRQSGAFMEEE